MKQEEQRLEQQRAENLRKIESLTTNLQNTQLSISQVCICLILARHLITVSIFVGESFNYAITRTDTTNERCNSCLWYGNRLRRCQWYFRPSFEYKSRFPGSTIYQSGFGQRWFFKTGISSRILQNFNFLCVFILSCRMVLKMIRLVIKMVSVLIKMDSKTILSVMVSVFRIADYGSSVKSLCVCFRSFQKQFGCLWLKWSF